MKCTVKKQLYFLLLFISFLLLSNIMVPTSALEGRFEYYQTNNKSNLVYGSRWCGQTFTVGTVGSNVVHNVTMIKLRLYRTGSPGQINVSIRATVSGLPNGSDLTSGTLNGNGLTTDSSGVWYEINMTSETAILVPDTMYAVVVRATSGSYPSNTVGWRAQAAGTYEGGTDVLSTDSGSSWVPSTDDYAFEVWGVINLGYTFIGILDEETGYLKPESERAVTVTAYFSDKANESFLVNGSYVYGTLTQPLYFHFELGQYDREYWVSSWEDQGTIYIFNSTLTGYVITFLDLAGVLEDHPYVLARRSINGSLLTIEKREVDVENKVAFSLIQNTRYDISLSDEGIEVFGDLLTTATTSITLTLTGIQFPKETLMTYKDTPIYGDRVFSTPNGSIKITYQDLLAMTDNITIYFCFKNGTVVHSYTTTSDAFSYNWTMADNSTDYLVQVYIYHARYGYFPWNQYFPCHLTSNPWSLTWFGTSLPFNTNIIIPSFLIVFFGGCFSVLNRKLGAFIMVIGAIIIVYMWSVPIATGFLIVAFTLAVLMAIIHGKRSVET